MSSGADKNQPLLHTRELGRICDPRTALVIFCNQPGGFALESVCDTKGYGRFSIFGFRPVREVRSIATSSGDVIGEPLSALAGALAATPSVDSAGLPFCGGWVGYIPYEIGAVAELVEPHEYGPAPELRMRLYDSAAIHDRRSGNWTLVAVDLPQSAERAEDRLQRMADLLSSVLPVGRPIQASENRPAGPRPVANMSRDEYLEKVEKSIDYIAAGDIYQVNLTQRFTTDVDVEPLDLYLRLRQVNPADYSAYLPWGDRAILSVSPELFLEVKGNRVMTRPIKGTASRTGDYALDAKVAGWLRASEKDRAELNMIVDLLRNDIGRVCSFGSVRVASAADVEVHPTVLHLVATIEGRMREDAGLVDLLRASFPGGSITGCPKIRAMQIIRELEPTPRDVYCGSIGWIGLDGTLCMNIAIRTMLYEAGRVHIYAGGAITADSDPEAEYEELMAKAAGMFKALGYCPAEVAAAAETLDRDGQSALLGDDTGDKTTPGAV